MRLTIAFLALGTVATARAQTPAQVPDNPVRLTTLPDVRCDSTRSDSLAGSTVIPWDSADVPPKIVSYSVIVAPDSLHHRYARSLLELVVDGKGRLDPCRVGVVEETSPAFTAAVLRALKKFRYSPAQRHGVAVAVRLIQPFENLPRD